MRGDQAVESAADKLEAIVQEAQRRGGIQAKAAGAFAEDPAFLRKLKPSLVAARAKGESPPDPTPHPLGPNGPQIPPDARPKAASKGPSPWLVVGAALLAGYALAKVIDWRGHAHPRA